MKLILQIPINIVSTIWILDQQIFLLHYISEQTKSLYWKSSQKQRFPNEV